MNTNTLNISEPCPADWSAMSGCETKRFCAQCTKNVHDLSAMTRRDAEVLVSSEKDLCVRYSLRPDGEIRFQEAAPRRGRRGAVKAALGAVLLATTPAFASGIPADVEKPNLLDRVIEQVRDFFGVEEEAVPVGCKLTTPPTQIVETPTVTTQTIPELDNPIATPVAPPPDEVIMMGEIEYEPPPPPVRMGRIARPR